MSKEKKQNGRRAYLRDFKVDSNGDYVYNGNMYDVSDGEDYGRAFKLAWVLAGILTASVIAKGCIPASGMLNTFYIIIPFMLETLSCGLLVYALIKLSIAKRPLREYVYKATVLKIPGRVSVMYTFSFISTFAYTVWLITGGEEKHTWCAFLFIILGITNGVCGIIFKRVFSANKFEKLAKPVIPKEDR